MMFMGILGMMMFFMLSGAFRAAGDAQTPLRLGIGMTVLTIFFNVILIRMYRNDRRRVRDDREQHDVSLYGLWFLTRPGSVIHFERGMDLKPDFTIIRSLFRFGLPTGVQGIAMNIGGVSCCASSGRLEHSAAAQAAFAVGYTELFSLITWTSNALMGRLATIAGQNLGRRQPGIVRWGLVVRVAARIGLCVALAIGALFWLIPGYLLAVFGMSDPQATLLATNLLRFLSILGSLRDDRAQLHRRFAGARGDTRSPLYISIVSQVILPLGFCTILQARAAAGQRHLARHRARPHDALPAQFRPLPPAEVARHPVDIEPADVGGGSRSGRCKGAYVTAKIGPWPTTLLCGDPARSPPVNDPNKGYLPGSPERAALKARLAEMAGERSRFRSSSAARRSAPAACSRR
jgi:hypothetical protein